MDEENNMADEKEITVANTHVPDKLYGYGLQVRQMLYELLNCDMDSVVSVEKFDDVGVESGNTRTAIQMKSALSNRNPVSDKAVDLWKTLYNWLLALKENELHLDVTLFTLVINVNKSGKVVTWLNQAHDKKEAETVYGKIRREFTGEDGKYIKQNDSINDYIVAFLAEKNKKYVLYIIEKFKLVVIGEGHTKVVYDEFRAKTYMPSDIQQLVFDKMLGWIDKITAMQIENGQVMQIAKARFNKELTLLQKMVNQNKCLVELAPNPTNTEIELQQNEYKTYLRQTPFVLYEKYSRRDVSLLMNCGKDMSSTMYGMSRIGDDVFIFITYHKEEAEEGKNYADGKPDYADAFEDNLIFKWDSQIGKDNSSPYMQKVLTAPRKHLLVKKSDAESSFYYMGQFDIIESVDSQKEDNSGKMKPIAKVTMKMHHPVREDLLRYLQSNISKENKAV